MKATNTDVLPAPPSLMGSLLAGFDAVTTHIALILFPIALDLFLWLGPRVRMTTIIQSFARQLFSFQGLESQEVAQAINSSQDFWQSIEHLNLLSALRSYPVGIPSLLSSRLLSKAPQGLNLLNLEVNSILGVIGIWLVLSLIGLFLGTLYFGAVSYAVKPVLERKFTTYRSWPWTYAQVFLLALFIGLLVIALSIPASCIISALALSSAALGNLGLLLYGAAVIWLLFPLIFSPHGIFVYRDNVMHSVKKGVRITRMTLPTTGLLILSVVIISQGMDLLWASPGEDTWLLFVGIIGHAFVTTGLLAATFVYYRKADQWIQGILAHMPENTQAKLKV